MKSVPLPAAAHRRTSRLLFYVVAGLTAAGAAWLIGRPSQVAVEPPREDAPVATESPQHPPWIYGRTDARFTIIEYADLQCEYCRAYFPVLRTWIDQHPEANWQWHHLPLSIHEPAATQAARVAECAGESGGNTAFWNMLAEIFASPQDPGEHQGIARVASASTPSMKDCVESQRPDAMIRAQLDAATREGIVATPTLRLVDNDTGASLILSGPAEGDALLSAIDWLIASPREEAAQADGGRATAPPPQDAAIHPQQP